MKKKPTILGPVFIVFFFLVAAGGLFIGSRILDRKMNKASIENDPFDAEGAEYSYKRGTLELADNYYDYFHNFDNYLIMGTDGSGNESGEGESFQNNLADFLLLMSIDKTDNSFSLLELNRDTITEVTLINKDGKGEATADEQLCTAHGYGGTVEQGSRNQVRAVSHLLGGLPILGYYSISMEDIPKLNKAIGGVTVTMADDFSKLDPAMKKGATLTLNDEQAYLYLRSRMNVGDGTNVARMERQHTYLEGFLSQSLTKLSGQPKYYYQLFETLTEIADTSLTGKQVSRIAKALTENTRKGLFEFDGVNKLGQILDDGLDHMEFYPDDESVVEVMTEIFQLREGEEGSDWDRDEWIESWKNFDWRNPDNEYEDEFDEDDTDDDFDEDDIDDSDETIADVGDESDEAESDTDNETEKVETDGNGKR